MMGRGSREIGFWRFRVSCPSPLWLEATSTFFTCLENRNYCIENTLRRPSWPLPILHRSSFDFGKAAEFGCRL